MKVLWGCNPRALPDFPLRGMAKGTATLALLGQIQIPIINMGAGVMLDFNNSDACIVGNSKSKSQIIRITNSR